jgi:hypothetical protein
MVGDPLGRREGGLRRGDTAALASMSERGARPGPTTDKRDRLKALERENRERRQANDTLRNASANFAAAELDRRSKPWSPPSTTTAGSTGSSRSAACGRSPRRLTMRMPRTGPIRRRPRCESRLRGHIRRFWEENFRVYGVRKARRHLGRVARTCPEPFCQPYQDPLGRRHGHPVRQAFRVGAGTRRCPRHLRVHTRLPLLKLTQPIFASRCPPSVLRPDARDVWPKIHHSAGTLWGASTSSRSMASRAVRSSWPRLAPSVKLTRSDTVNLSSTDPSVGFQSGSCTM